MYNVAYTGLKEPDLTVTCFRSTLVCTLDLWIHVIRDIVLTHIFVATVYV